MYLFPSFAARCRIKRPRRGDKQVTSSPWTKVTWLHLCAPSFSLAQHSHVFIVIEKPHLKETLKNDLADTCLNSLNWCLGKRRRTQALLGPVPLGTQEITRAGPDHRGTSVKKNSRPVGTQLPSSLSALFPRLKRQKSCFWASVLVVVSVIFHSTWFWNLLAGPIYSQTWIVCSS